MTGIMIEVSAWAWPQWTVVGMLAFSLVLNALLDGHPRTGTHRFSVRLVDAAIMVFLLVMGGFFA